jgi:hypothetical protein
MDEFVNLIIFGVLILLSTLFGGKKKKSPGARPPSGPRPEPRTQPRPDLPAQRTMPTPQADRPREVATLPLSQVAKKPETFRDLFELLQQQAEPAARGPELVVEDAPPPPPPHTRTRRNESIETPVPAGEARHERFHDKYVRPLEAPAVKSPPRFVVPRGPKSLKQAVVWSEILGSPKGME